MLVFWERRKLGEKGNQQQTQTTYDINNWTWSWITLVGGRCFQCWTIPVPPMCRKSSINSPLLIIPPFWERKLISPSPRHLPSYDKLYWLNTTVTLHVDWSDMACWRAGSTDFIVFYTILIFYLWLYDLPTSCTWSFSLSILVLYEELIPSSLLNYPPPPSSLNVLEINKPHERLNRGFTVDRELKEDCIWRVLYLSRKQSAIKKRLPFFVVFLTRAFRRGKDRFREWEFRQHHPHHSLVLTWSKAFLLLSTCWVS